MKKNITIDEVKHIAKLSKLDIPDNEIEFYRQEMDKILAHFNKLSDVNTEDIEPLTHVLDMENVMGEDKIEPSLDRKIVLKNAPDTHGNYIKVPNILKKDK